MTFVPWGSTLTVTTEAGAQGATVTAISQDRFVVVWEDSSAQGSDASGSAVRLRLYDPFGIPLTGPLQVNTAVAGAQANAQVLDLRGGGFVVVWEDSSASGADTSGRALRGQRFDANGQKLGLEFLVNTTTAGDQVGVTLARSGQGFVAAWVDLGGATPDIRAQIFDATGAKVGAEFLVGASQAGAQLQVRASEARLVQEGPPAQGFAIAWSSDADGNGSIDGIRVQAYDNAGAARGPENAITTAGAGLHGLHDVVSVDGWGVFGVAYRDDVTGSPGAEYRIRTFDSQGSPTGGPYTVAESANGFEVTDVALAGYGTRTGGPANSAVAISGGSSASGTGGVAFARPGWAELTDVSTVRSTTFAATPRVLDASVMDDGRVVSVAQEASGSISFTIADGRGGISAVASYSPGEPLVAVGTDIGSHAHDRMFGGYSANQLSTLYGLGGNDSMYGSQYRDVLVGGRGVDVLIAYNDDDVLYGEEDQDYLWGGSGSNVFVGGAGVDVLVSEDTSVADVMYGGDDGDYFYAYGTGTVLLGEAGNDILLATRAASAWGGDGQDYFYMGAGSDQMHGDAGVDVLLGGGGGDVFDGGADVDYLFLGAGSDTVLMNLQSSVDVVNDFDTRQDFVRLQGTGITSYAQLLASTTDFGSFSVITIDANTAIWLVGIAPSQFTPNNFQFS